MVDIVIKNVDPRVMRALEARARANARSVPEEASSVLSRAGASEFGFGSAFFSALPADLRGDDVSFVLFSTQRPPPDFG